MSGEQGVDVSGLNPTPIGYLLPSATSLTSMSSTALLLVAGAFIQSTQPSDQRKKLHRVVADILCYTSMENALVSTALSVSATESIVPLCSWVTRDV